MLSPVLDVVANVVTPFDMFQPSVVLIIERIVLFEAECKTVPKEQPSKLVPEPETLSDAEKLSVPFETIIATDALDAQYWLWQLWVAASEMVSVAEDEGKDMFVVPENESELGDGGV